MGGPGSGRWPSDGGRATVESCLVLDVDRLRREGHLEPGRWGAGASPRSGPGPSRAGSC
jgi:hypothetical protein